MDKRRNRCVLRPATRIAILLHTLIRDTSGEVSDRLLSVMPKIISWSVCLQVFSVLGYQQFGSVHGLINSSEKGSTGHKLFFLFNICHCWLRILELSLDRSLRHLVLLSRKLKRNRIFSISAAWLAVIYTWT